jgi:glycosyltransferase involved in cell wall biosynthesis
MNLISIVMNCYNGEEFLKQSIDSVLIQSHTNWEIIFYDNASTDNSKKIVKSYNDARIKYFFNKKNIKLGSARNIALSKCNGDYIAFLDVDDIWLVDKLKLQLELFLKKPDLGLVYSDSIWFNEKSKAQKKSLNKNSKLRGFCFRKLLNNYMLTMSSVILNRKALLEQSEFFDERFELLEESDLFKRIAYEWEIDFVDDPLVKWRIHGKSSTWEHYSKIHIEGLLMLEKFSKLYQNFDLKFSNEIKKYKAILIRRKAISLWSKNKNYDARKIILKSIFVDKKNFVLFFLMFFSHSFYLKLTSKVRLGLN